MSMEIAGNKRDLLKQVRYILELQAQLLERLGVLIEDVVREEKTDRAIPGVDHCYTVQEAARLLRVSESTVRRLIARGKLRRRKLGSRVVIPASELRKLVSTEP